MITPLCDRNISGRLCESKDAANSLTKPAVFFASTGCICIMPQRKSIEISIDSRWGVKYE